MSTEDRETRSSVRPCGPNHAEVEAVVDATSEHTLWCDLAMRVEGGGVFVATHLELPVGTSITLALWLPNQTEALSLRGVVSWTRPYFFDADVPAGLGVKLLDLDDDARAMLSQFAELREPLFFDDQDDEECPSSRAA